MKLFSISNEYIEVKFLDYGGRITEINSVFTSFPLVLNYYEHEEYLSDDLYIGAIAGRYANRIGNASFTLNGKKYTLDDNDNGNCLHGGNKGYDKQFFDVECSHSTAILTLHDQAGVFPANVDVKIKYSVIGSSFIIQYLASPDAHTVINLTNHTYFDPQGSIDECIAVFNAEKYTPIGENMIPTGICADVKNTPFDFTSPRKIGEFIDCNDEQIVKAGGYDHNFIINGDGLRQAAAVYMPGNGMTLKVITNTPGFQFYTGNFLHEPFEKRSGFCIETQSFPDSPNKPEFPSCVYTPEKPFRAKTIYQFAVGNQTSE